MSARAGARWGWHDEQVTVDDLRGVGSVSLAVEGDKIENPPNPGVYSFPSEFPDGDWLVRIGGDVPPC